MTCSLRVHLCYDLPKSILVTVRTGSGCLEIMQAIREQRPEILEPEYAYYVDNRWYWGWSLIRGSKK